MPAVHIQDMKIGTTITWKETDQTERARAKTGDNVAAAATGGDDDSDEGNGDVEIFGIGGAAAAASSAVRVAESANVTVSVALAGFPLLELGLETIDKTTLPSSTKSKLRSPLVGSVAKNGMGGGGHEYARCPASFWLTAFLL